MAPNDARLLFVDVRSLRITPEPLLIPAGTVKGMRAEEVRINASGVQKGEEMRRGATRIALDGGLM